MEEVDAATDNTIPVGAGAIKQLSDSLRSLIAYATTTKTQSFEGNYVTSISGDTVPKPSDSSYEWYCISISTDSSAIYIVSITAHSGGSRFYNSATTRDATVTWYWLGIKK